MSTRKKSPKPVDISSLPPDLKKLVIENKEDFFYNPEELKHAIKEKRELSKLLPSIRRGRTPKHFELTMKEEELLKTLKTKKEMEKEFDEKMENDMSKLSFPDRKAFSAKKRRNKKIEKRLEEYLDSLKSKKGGRRTMKNRRTRKNK